jgi:hypothetical protein
MFHFAGSVIDEKTNKSRYVILSSEKNFWRDDRRIRYDKKTGSGLLVKRLHLDVKTIFPIIFTHAGHVKNNKESARSTGKKVFLTRFTDDLWITHHKEYFHAGHGLNIVLKNFEMLPGDHRRYLVLFTLEKLMTPISFRKVEEYRHVL